MKAGPSLDWILALVANGEPESTTLDFKRELPGKQDKDRKDFLSDVVALANTHGGQIVYGIDEVGSHADVLTPISGVTPEVARQRLNEMIHRGIEPTLRGVTFETIEVDGGFVLVLTVDQQIGAGPFRTNYDGSQRFTYREGTQNFPMPYSLIRNAFGVRASAVERLDSWRDRRLGDLGIKIAGRAMKKGPWLVLHVLPVSSFIDPASISPRAFYKDTFQFGGNSAFHRYNLDGLVFFNAPNEFDSSKYVQFFRNGVAESGRELQRSISAEKNGADCLDLTALAFDLRAMLGGVSSKLSAVGIAGESYFCLSILNGENWDMVHAVGHGFEDRLPSRIPSKAVILPPVVDDLPTTQIDTDTVLRSILDTVWQMAGVDSCPYFSGDGLWAPPNFYR